MRHASIQLHLRIWSLLFSLCPLFSFCESLEVALPTKSHKTPLYLTQIHVVDSGHDWRYFDELRDVFAFDLNHNGSSVLLPTQNVLEDALVWEDLRGTLDLSAWKEQKIPYLLTIQMTENRFHLTVFDVFQETSKKYPEFLLNGRLEVDRKELHRLADMVQKDLFKTEGIASRRILFAKRFKEENEWHSEIWICDSDGADAKKILRENGYTVSPAFFPPSVSQGDAFYYVSFRDGQSKIYRSSLQQSTGEEILSLRGSQALPTVNLQGTQMAFISDVAGRPDLFIQNLDAQAKPKGKPRQLFSAARATQASPTYSPDGKKIAFVSDKDGSPRIYVMDVCDAKATKKPSPHLITKLNRENTCPAWSPDGKRLAYSAKVEGVRQIWMYDFRTGEESAVTTGPQHKENPAWAPDSLHLLYNTETNDVCELYRIHMRTKDILQLSKGPDQSRFAAWSFLK